MKINLIQISILLAIYVFTDIYLELLNGCTMKQLLLRLFIDIILSFIVLYGICIY